MKKEIDMGMFLEDDARYADVVNVFGDMPEGTVTEDAVEPYDTKMYAVGTFLLPRYWGQKPQYTFVPTI